MWIYKKNRHTWGRTRCGGVLSGKMLYLYCSLEDFLAILDDDTLDL